MKSYWEKIQFKPFWLVPKVLSASNVLLIDSYFIVSSSSQLSSSSAIKISMFTHYPYLILSQWSICVTQLLIIYVNNYLYLSSHAWVLSGQAAVWLVTQYYSEA